MRISDWSSDVCSSDLPNGVPVPYYYTNPTMIGFTGGGGSTYGGGAEPFIMPVVGDWSPPPAYSQSYYDKSREKASPGYYSVYPDTFRKIGRASCRERVCQYV